MGNGTAGPPPAAPGHSIAALVLGILLILLIVGGNGLVCLSVCTERALKTTTNYFIVSLAVADLLLALLVLPLYVYSEVRQAGDSGGRRAGACVPAEPAGYEAAGGQETKHRGSKPLSGLPPHRCPAGRGVSPPGTALSPGMWRSDPPALTCERHGIAQRCGTAGGGELSPLRASSWDPRPNRAEWRCPEWRKAGWQSLGLHAVQVAVTKWLGRDRCCALFGIK